MTQPVPPSPGGPVLRDVHAGAARDLYVARTINVRFDAPPPFSLNLLAPRSDPDPDAGPSQWLLARHEVVDFHGAAAHATLDELRLWLETPPPRAAQLVPGPGGRGKSRLGVALARAAHTAGWHVLLARPDEDGLPIAEDGLMVVPVRPPDATGVLVLVDYADRWKDKPLRAVFDHPDLTPVGLPVRVLLLARTGDFWPALRDSLDQRGWRAGVQTAPGLGEANTGERGAAYDHALAAFADRLGLARERVPSRPPDLAGRDYSLTLAVHMTALATVLAVAAGETPPGSAEEASRFLLGRERRHWRQMANRTRSSEGIGEQPMSRAVLLACLVQRCTYRQAIALLQRRECGNDPQGLLDLHTRCYPPTVPGTLLEPLQPDRLAEDYIAVVVVDDPTAMALVEDLLAVPDRSEPGQSSAFAGSQLGAALTVLVEAAHRHRQLADHLVLPMIATAPQHALALSGSTLARLATLPGLDPTTAAAVRGHLSEAIGPAGVHTAYALGMAAFTEVLHGSALTTTTEPSTRAELLTEMAYWHSQAGRREEALGPAEEAVQIYRRLAEANPAAYLPALASALNNLGIRFFEVGRREEALGPAEEAVQIRRRLAEANPAAYLPDLAMSLNNLGAFFSEVGRREEALGLAEEAVQIYRRLAEANPAAYLPDLAMSLNNLGIRFSEVGRREEALAPAEEAVQIRRRLAEANPAAYLPALASALNNLGAFFSEVGRREEALGPAEEAVQIRRRLAEANPAAYLPALASALNNLGAFFSEVGRREEALASAEEAVQIRRRLAEANPAAYLPDLASALNNLGAFFSEVGRREEALGPAEEAVQIYRRLAEANPAAYLPDLASALNNLGTRFSEVGRREEALGPAEEAVQIYRRLAEANPAAYLPALASALNNLGTRFSEVGRREEALGPAEEAVQIRRRLAEANPAAYLPALAMSLNNLGIRFSEVGRREEALAPAEEAVQIRRRLAEANPAAYLPALASALNNLGIRFSEVGRREEALAPAEEAVQIYRRLAEANSAAYLPDLAMSLWAVGRISAASDLPAPRGREATEQAVAIFRELASRLPAAFSGQLEAARATLTQLRERETERTESENAARRGRDDGVGPPAGEPS